MAMAVPVRTAELNLEDFLKQLHPGDTVTLLGAEGEPVAILVSLIPAPADQVRSLSEWQAEWETLAQEISRAWKGEQSAVETLSEMRR